MEISFGEEIENVTNKVSCMKQKKRIALIAHDHNKPDMLEWVRFNKGTLLKHEL